MQVSEGFSDMDKVGLSPVLTSSQCNNDHLMAEVARLYLRTGDRIADVTFGKGRFWRKVDLGQYDFHPSDLLTVPACAVQRCCCFLWVRDPHRYLIVPTGSSRSCCGGNEATGAFEGKGLPWAVQRAGGP